MRRMALLFAGGCLWLLLMAAPTFADGGPHQLAINSGTSGLSGDCAACHRAHTSDAAFLLKSDQPGLCLACHNGTGATTNVVDGIQYTPTGGSTYQQSTVLGALRGGGFSYALIDTGNASRLGYSSRGGITLTYGAVPGAGAMSLTWPAFGSFGGGALNFTANDTAANVQIAADTLFGVSATYSGSTSLAYMSGLPAGGSNVVVTKSSDNKYFTFAPQNALRLAKMPLPAVTTNGSGTTATMTDGISVGFASKVGVLASGQAVTSTHTGPGTVWGNGPQGQNNAGATGVVLECTDCHNPHGNGQYRILQTLPGSSWKTGTAGVLSWTAPTNAVEVIDGPALTAGQVRNYTVLPTTGNSGLAADVIGSSTSGDYFRSKYDPSGQANFTNFYLLKDPMNSGWNGQTPTNAAAIASIPNTQLGAALSATATSATVASTAGMPTHTPTTEPQPLFLVKIGSEIIQASVTDGTHLKISRAQYGTTAAAYSSGATVTIVGTGASQDAADVPLYNNLGRMTAYCIACHTRYNGWAQNGTSSYAGEQTPIDSIFGYKHGTTSTGCEQCHVNHGTNAAMTGVSAGVLFPDGTVEDSALLKVNNRGTCELCHDPTGTVIAGTTVGTVPSSISPGP